MSEANNCVFVSVVVTTYNREKYLKETLEAILKQTYQNFELIVVDNYSNYDFNAFIDSFNSKKIRAFQNHNNGIIAVNRNFGISKAKGDYIAFCDDDDIWDVNKLEKQVQFVHQKGIELLSTQLIIFGEGVEKEYARVCTYKNKHEVFFENYFTPSTLLVKKSKLVHFNESKDFNCAEDWTMCLELIINGYKYYQMRDPLVRYRVFASNMTKKNAVNVQLQHVKILKYLKTKYGGRFQNRYYFVGLTYQYAKNISKLILKPLLPLYRYIRRNIFKKAL